MVCRNLFGKPVRVELQDRRQSRVAPKIWSKLEPSEIDQLPGSEICHYEAVLGLSALRSWTNRLTRLKHFTQRNVLTSAVLPASLTNFLALSEDMRHQLSAEELQR